MNNCQTCGNAILDARWGDYKCKVYERRIRDVNKHINCPDHKKKEDKE